MKTITKISRIIVAFVIILITSIASAHVTDTLKCHLTAGTPTIYPAPTMGFISGNNNFGDVEIAQKYGIDTAATDCAATDSADMSEVAVWFAAKTLGLNDSVRVKVYSVHPITGAPDQLLSTSFPISINYIDTSLTLDTFLVEFLLPAPLILTDSFFVSVVLPVGDIVGIISDTDGEGQGKRLGWVKQSSGIWSDVLTLRNLDIDFAIFPKPDAAAPLNVVNYKRLNDNIISYPNPVNDNFTLKLETKKKLSEIEMSITNVQGKKVSNVRWTSSEIQRKTKQINVSQLPIGTYFYTIITDYEQGRGKFVIVK